MEVVGRGIGGGRRLSLKKGKKRVKVTLTRTALGQAAMLNAFVGDQACAGFYSLRLPLSPERAGSRSGMSSLGHKRRQRNSIATSTRQ